MSDIVELVPAADLPEMLDEAFFEAGQYNDGVTVEQEDVFFDETPSKTAVWGTATIHWDHDRGHSEEFSFEVNLGTGQDVVVFDPLEVVIDFEEDIVEGVA